LWMELQGGRVDACDDAVRELFMAIVLPKLLRPSIYVLKVGSVCAYE
jgi:hypothetical protein